MSTSKVILFDNRQEPPIIFIGFPIARLLLQETNVRLVLAGRSLEKAEKTASFFALPRMTLSR